MMESVGWDISMLEAPLGEDRHLQASHGGDASRDDFAFELIKSLDVVVREVDEGYPFRDGDDVRSSIRAETAEAMLVRRRISACVRTAKSTAICQRVFDL